MFWNSEKYHFLFALNLVTVLLNLLLCDILRNGGKRFIPFDLYRFVHLSIAPYHIPFPMWRVQFYLSYFCAAAFCRICLTSWHLFSPIYPFEADREEILNYSRWKFMIYLYDSPFFFHVFLCILLSWLITKHASREPSIINLASLSCVEIIYLEPISKNVL